MELELEQRGVQKDTQAFVLYRIAISIQKDCFFRLDLKVPKKNSYAPACEKKHEEAKGNTNEFIYSRIDHSKASPQSLISRQSMPFSDF